VILVDSNILIDVIGGDPVWAERSAAALAEAADEAELAVNPIIYAEISVAFPSEKELERVLGPARLLRLPLPYEAAFVAGKAFLEYRRRGGARTSPLPDFYIGAHAAVSGLTLLTRDLSRYRTYFPKLQLWTP
jgi:predicted nucleic acid-binding protein